MGQYDKTKERRRHQFKGHALIQPSIAGKKWMEVDPPSGQFVCEGPQVKYYPKGELLDTVFLHMMHLRPGEELSSA